MTKSNLETDKAIKGVHSRFIYQLVYAIIDTYIKFTLALSNLLQTQLHSPAAKLYNTPADTNYRKTGKF